MYRRRDHLNDQMLYNGMLSLDLGISGLWEMRHHPIQRRFKGSPLSADEIQTTNATAIAATCLDADGFLFIPVLKRLEVDTTGFFKKAHCDMEGVLIDETSRLIVWRGSASVSKPYSGPGLLGALLYDVRTFGETSEGQALQEAALKLCWQFPKDYSAK